MKRMFSFFVHQLFILMSVVFLLSSCKSQSQSDQRGSEKLTITYSTAHGTTPKSKTVEQCYKLTLSRFTLHFSFLFSRSIYVCIQCVFSFFNPT